MDVIHGEFYRSLEALWHKHQPNYPGYKDVALVMHE